MNLKINPKPADEVIQKEGNFFIDDSALEKDNFKLIDDSFSNEAGISLDSEILKNENIDIDLGNDIQPIINIENEPKKESIALDPIKKSMNFRSTMKNVDNVDTNTQPQQQIYNTVLATPVIPSEKPPIVNNKPVISHVDRVTTFSGNIGTMDPDSIFSSKMDGQNIRREDDRIVEIDLLRTNVYYAKKMCQEIEDLRASINRQTYIKMFTTFVILGISIFSLYYGFQMSKEFMNNDFSSLKPIMDMVGGGDLKGNIMGKLTEVFGNMGNNPVLSDQVNNITNNGITDISVDFPSNGNDLTQEEINAIIKSTVK